VTREIIARETPDIPTRDIKEKGGEKKQEANQFEIMKKTPCWQHCTQERAPAYSEFVAPVWGLKLLLYEALSY
jgi:hypothetical protein